MGCHGYQPLPKFTRHVHHGSDKGQDPKGQQPECLSYPPQQDGYRKINQHVHTVIAKDQSCPELADCPEDGFLSLILPLVAPHVKGIVAPPSSSRQHPRRQLRQFDKDRPAECLSLLGRDPAAQYPHPRASRQNLPPRRAARREILRCAALIKALLVGESRIGQNAYALILLVLDVLVAAPLVERLHAARLHDFVDGGRMSLLRLHNLGVAVAVHTRQR